MTKRIFDLILSFICVIIFTPIFIIISILLKVSSKGSIIYWSRRVGLNNKIFFMPKFRSMNIDTKETSTANLKDPHNQITYIGSFIRKYSIDELPQLWSVLKGDMSIVGPRPLLISEDDILTMRANKEINSIKPGITGWAQVNGRDNISNQRKVELDLEYKEKQSIFFDCLIILYTIRILMLRTDISH